ncbi:hypothetical protein CHRYSEO8AT_350052 [Chryseobacterium sp. 8AT]|nr:hypothetical protein CHRYSEO8AT_350052 [Chryseobacterium sp. 8AT]
MITKTFISFVIFVDLKEFLLGWLKKLTKNNFENSVKVFDKKEFELAFHYHYIL